MANKNKHISHIKSNVSVNSYVSKADSSVVITSEQYEALSSSEKENYTLKAEPKLPSASDILYGEIAVNYKDDVETLSIKNDNDEIVEFASKKYVSELVPTPTSLDADKFLKGDGTWATPPTASYPKGSAEDLNTGTDTAEKVWDAKTIADYVQDNTAAATKFKGGFNAGTGEIDGGSTTLTSVSEKIGDMYTATTAGTFVGTPMEVGDSIIFKKAVAKNTAPTANDVVFVEGAVSVTNTGNTLDWNTDVTVATVEGVNITTKLPANPNTDTTYTFADGTSSTGDGTFTVTPSGGSAQSVTVYNVQSKVAATGSATKPVYTSADGTFAACDDYAGGTAVTLNGTSKSGDSAGFYAPTTAGANGQILVSNGGGEPSWVNNTNTNSATLQISDTTNKKVNTTETPSSYLQFASGTNKFTVSDGTNQFDVDVTPSIADNVTGSGLTADSIVVGNGNSTVKTSGKTIVTSLGGDDTTIPTSKAVQDAIDALPEPMVFKGTLGTGGTISSLPEASSSNEGFTYKVITDGTYAGQTAKIGDLFISNGTAWNLVPSGDEPSGTVTNVATGTGLTGGPITTSGTISHADTSSQASVSNSGRTYIQSVTLDDMGHVTGLSSATETVVNTDRYVNSAAFADDSTSTPASPVKMTLTRAGSDTGTVTANLPKVSSASAGVAPKGAAVTTQSQSTKFLREDGTWAAPSYTQASGDVTGPSSSTDAHVAVFNGATGKVIKDSGFTIGKSVPSDAVFTDTPSVFYAVYGTTTYSEIDAAYNAGKYIIVSRALNGTTFYGLADKDANGTYYFRTFSNASNTNYGCYITSSSTWAVNSYTYQANVAAKGSTTKPVYTSAAGTFSECSTYAGGTAVTLNGTSAAASTASFYAPTSAGTSGYYLKSNGSGAPSWGSISLPSAGNASTLSTGTSTTAYTWSASVLNAAIGTGATTATSISTVPISHRVVVVTLSSGSAGNFSLATGLTKGREVHVIVKNTGTSSDYTITIPHSPTASTGYKYVNTVDNASGNVVVPKSSGGYVEINALYDGTYVYLRYA